MEEKGIVLVADSDGVFRKKEEPFAMIECETEEDFDRLQEMLARNAWHKCDELPTEKEVLAVVLCRGRLRYEIGVVDGQDVIARGAGKVVRWAYLPDMPEVVT